MTESTEKISNTPVSAEALLEKAGLKPTSNRLLVLRRLMDSKGARSLIELETELETIDRSSILRVLNLLVQNDVVHTIEDGKGIIKYELCHGESHCSIDDMHAHFYCEKCERTFCFEDISAPLINLPSNFHIRSVNYMLKGLCPDCAPAL